MEDNYIRKAEVLRVVDGDTIMVSVDCGFRRFSHEMIRLNRIDTQEIRWIDKIYGLIAKDFVVDCLEIGSTIYIKTYKGDAFGRWLAEVYFHDEETDEWINLNDVLLDNGLAVIYEK